jgi:hypothetical protein
VRCDGPQTKEALVSGTKTEFDVRHTSSHPFLLGASLLAASALLIAAISPSTDMERAEDRIAHYSESDLESGKIRDVSDRLSRGRFTFDPDTKASPSDRMLVLDLGHGIAGLCAEGGGELRAELLLSQDLLSRPAFERPDLNDRLTPICQKIMA